MLVFLGQVERWLTEVATRQLAELDKLGALQTGSALSRFECRLCAYARQSWLLRPVETYRSPLERGGLGRSILLSAGLPPGLCDRVYVALFVYSVGGYCRVLAARIAQLLTRAQDYATR